MTGLIVPLDSQRNATTMVFNDSVHRMPKSLDYRKKGWVSSVKNQVRLLPPGSDSAQARVARIHPSLPEKSKRKQENFLVQVLTRHKMAADAVNRQQQP